MFLPISWGREPSENSQSGSLDVFFSVVVAAAAVVVALVVAAVVVVVVSAG